MVISKLAELGESALSSGKASLSVVLVLSAGYFLRKTGRISKEAEGNISKLGKLPISRLRGCAPGEALSGTDVGW